MTASVAELLGDYLTNGNSFTQTNLVSDGTVPAEHTDPNLINPWGISDPWTHGAFLDIGQQCRRDDVLQPRRHEGRSGCDRPAARSDWRRDSHGPGFQQHAGIQHYAKRQDRARPFHIRDRGRHHLRMESERESQ